MRPTCLLLLAIVGTGVLADSVRLDELDLALIKQGWGTARACQSVGGRPLQLAGRTFAHGVGTHAPSLAVLALGGTATRFTATVGVNDTGRNEPGSVEFIVLGDGRELARTPVLHGGDAPVMLEVPLAGVQRLELRVTDGGDNVHSDHADWADATLTYTGRRPTMLDPQAEVVPASATIQSPGDTTYFVDPTQGDDAHTGLSAAQAWRTLVPVNARRLAPGDRVEILAPGRFDQTLRPAGAGTAEKPIRIHFAAGAYDFWPVDAVKLKLHISNSNDDPGTPKPVAWLFQDVQHVRVTGEQSDIFVHGKMLELMCDRAVDVAFEGLNFDYRRPLVSEFTVTEVAERSADVSVQADSTYAVEHGQLVWVGEGWRSAGKALNQEFDPADDKRTWRRGNGPLTGVTRVEELAPRRLRLHFDRNPGLVKGHVIQFRETYRDIASGFINRSRDIAWRRGAFHALGGMGLVHQFSENLTYEQMQFAPRPGSGRTSVAWADMLHFSGCRGQLTIDGVNFSGSHDDPINVHGTHLRLVGQPAANQVTVRFMHGQTYGFPAFVAGDQVDFVNHVNLRPYASAKVTAAVLQDERQMLLTLDGPVPAWQPNDVLENVTWTPSVTIRNCRVEADSCRGFLLTTRGKVTVEGCTFVKTSMSAILIADDANSWFESGPVRDVTIRGNTFIRCAEPVIAIAPENHTAKPDEPVHSGIVIVDNRFDLRGGSAIWAKSVRGLTITGNRFSSPTLPVQTTACSEVVVRANELGVR